MLRQAVNGFAQDRIAPRADEIDRSNIFPRDLWPEMGALGLHGITVEEEYGGSAQGYLAHCVAMEEISRASASVGLSYGAHSNLCVNQPASTSPRWPCRSRRRGSDVVSMRTRADKVGDRYVLNGSKMWITQRPIAETLVV